MHLKLKLRRKAQMLLSIKSTGSNSIGHQFRFQLYWSSVRFRLFNKLSLRKFGYRCEKIFFESNSKVLVWANYKSPPQIYRFINYATFSFIVKPHQRYCVGCNVKYVPKGYGDVAFDWLQSFHLKLVSWKHM